MTTKDKAFMFRVDPAMHEAMILVSGLDDRSAAYWIRKLIEEGIDEVFVRCKCGEGWYISGECNACGGKACETCGGTERVGDNPCSCGGE